MVIVAVLVVLVVFAVRVRLLSVPLERDEGEYAYAAQQWLQGVPPYASIYHMKLPGTYAAYMLILAAFGETVEAIHFGGLLINAANAALLFLLGRRMFGAPGGAFAGALYLLLSLGSGLQGTTANAEHFLLLPALGGLWFTLRALATNHATRSRAASFVAAGFLLGTAVIMKQPAAFFLAFALAFVLLLGIRQKLKPVAVATDVIPLALASVVPFGLTSLYFWQQGLFNQFWWWTMVYPTSYGEGLPASSAFNNFVAGAMNGFSSSWPALVLAALGFGSLKRVLRPADRDSVIGWSLAAFIAIIPGFHFHPHYFQLLTPCLAIAATAGLQRLGILHAQGTTASQVRSLTLAAMLLCMGYPLWSDRGYLFQWSAEKVSGAVYGANPFPESKLVADFIQEHTGPTDHVAVFGSEPQILFLAKRRSATGFIYMYEAMRNHRHAAGFQERILQEVRASRPAAAVAVAIQTSWLASTPAPSANEFGVQVEEFLRQGYHQVGMICIAYPAVPRSKSCFDPAGGCRPISELYLSLYIRN